MTAGTFWQIVKRLTVDKKGIRGDQPGFDPKNVATYGLGNIESTGDPFGQNNWGMLLATDGINIPDRNQWATQFNYADPQVIKSVKLIRALSDRRLLPAVEPVLHRRCRPDRLRQGRHAARWHLGCLRRSQHCQAARSGSHRWSTGSNGKRALMANSNGNNIWAGTKHPDQTWKWVSYQESADCQTKASKLQRIVPAVHRHLDGRARRRRRRRRASTSPSSPSISATMNSSPARSTTTAQPSPTR